MPLAPPPQELAARLEAFRESLRRQRLTGFLVTDPANVRYLSGFTGSDSALLLTGRRRLLLTDFRYLEEAQASAPGWRVILKPDALMEKAGLYARKLRLRRLGVEPENLTLAQLKSLRKSAGPVALRPRAKLVEDLRLCKSAWEVRRIEAALRVQEACFRQVCAWLRPGIREDEAAAEMRYRLVRAGAEDQAFDCIFQFDANASRPHGRPTSRRLRPDSLVLVDWGARVGGYHSDLTRSFFMGRIPRRLREIHEVVAEAQRRAREAVSPGVLFAQVDRAARSFIRQAGYGRCFGHSTGHGLGLRVHEAPRLSSRAKGALKPGMVVTIEPGIYVPGAGGVRIEDDVLVTETGRRVLSRLPVGLRWDGRKV